MSTKKKSNKKEHYVEDLRKRFDDIIKNARSGLLLAG